MKTTKIGWSKMLLLDLVGLGMSLTSCASIPYTGQLEMIGESSKKANAESFANYDYILKANSALIVTGTADAKMVDEVAKRIINAAEEWAAANGKSSYLAGYEWDIRLFRTDEQNAWCMAGGKMAVYTGILPITKNADGLAAVMGHEVAHALLLHSQREKGVEGFPALLGAFFLSLFKTTMEQSGGSFEYGTEAHLTSLPNSRAMEIEADKLGLTLMTIAGYDPNAAPDVWDRWTALSGDDYPEYLSTHPSNARRASNLRKEIPAAKKIAAKVDTGRYARQFLTKTFSIGGGAAWNLRSELSLSSTEDGVSTTGVNMGYTAFFDAKYALADVNFIPALNGESAYFNGGLVFKYPFETGDKVAWFPELGVGVEMAGNEKLEFGLKFGAGVDIMLVKHIFLRATIDGTWLPVTAGESLYGNFSAGLGYAF